MSYARERLQEEEQRGKNECGEKGLSDIEPTSQQEHHEYSWSLGLTLEKKQIPAQQPPHNLQLLDLTLN